MVFGQCVPSVDVDKTNKFVQDVRVDEVSEYRKTYFRESQNPTHLHQVDIELLRYRGSSQLPMWLDNEPSEDFLFLPHFLPSPSSVAMPTNHNLTTKDLYSSLCTIKADTQRLCQLSGRDPTTGMYKIEFELLLSFGLTELKAQMCWQEDVSAQFSVSGCVLIFFLIFFFMWM